MKTTAMNSKIQSLQALRAVAFLIIFSGHAGLNKWSAGGVSIFLVLSGFLMMYKHHNEDISCDLKSNILFSIKRIRKLYPLHLIMLFAALPFAAYTYLLTPSREQLVQTGLSFISDVALIQAWIPVDKYYFSLNSLSWYLSAYMFILICFPFILIRLKNNSRKTAWIRIICSYAIQIVFGLLLTVLLSNYSFREDLIKYYTYIFPIFRLGDFYIGCNLFFLLDNTSQKECNKNVVLSTLFEIGAVLLYMIAQFFFSKEIGLLGNGFAKWSIIFEPESARVAKRQVIIKDHTKTGLLSVIKLRMMDYVGNRHYGVRLPYNYLTKDEWSRLFQENNLIINNYNVSLNLYKGIFHVIFDKGLHFIADLRKLT